MIATTAQGAEMTQDTPQGVAQRVMDGQRTSVVLAKGLSNIEHAYRESELKAMQRMHKALSAEARRVLAEWTTQLLPDGKDVEYVLLEDAFLRLGLDLSEPEDSDE